jgi:hypothetical protein
MEDNLKEKENIEKNCSNNNQDPNNIVTNILIMKKDTNNLDEVNQMIAEQCTLLSPIKSERSRNIKLISDNNLNSKFKDEIFDKGEMSDLKSKSINNPQEKRNEDDDKEILDFIISKVKTNKKSSKIEFIYLFYVDVKDSSITGVSFSKLDDNSFLNLNAIQDSPQFGKRSKLKSNITVKKSSTNYYYDKNENSNEESLTENCIF